MKTANRIVASIAAIVYLASAAYVTLCWYYGWPLSGLLIVCIVAGLVSGADAAMKRAFLPSPPAPR